MKTITFKAIEFNGAAEAIQWASASRRGEVVLIGSGHYVIEHNEAEQLAASGVEFSHLFDHEMSDERSVIVSVPIN